MDIPYWLVGESGEKRCMDSFSDLYNGATDIFTESLFIADFFAESYTADEDDLLA